MPSGCPVSCLVQAWQAPTQAPLQQTASGEQNPSAHSSLAAQPAPTSFCVLQVPFEQ